MGCQVKDHVDVFYLDMIRDYNQSMGGVDLSDMLMALYRVDIQTTKRSHLKIITHCLNICNVNAWLLYQRYIQQLNVRKSNQIMFLQFTKNCASGLLLDIDVRYGGIHHWLEFRETRNRCRVCSYLSFIYCSKYHMCLCLQKGRNCFMISITNAVKPDQELVLLS